MEKRRMWLVLGAFKRIRNGDELFEFDDGSAYAPMFEDRATAEEFADGKHAIVAVDVYDEDDLL